MAKKNDAHSQLNGFSFCNTVTYECKHNMPKFQKIIYQFSVTDEIHQLNGSYKYLKWTCMFLYIHGAHLYINIHPLSTVRQAITTLI